MPFDLFIKMLKNRVEAIEDSENESSIPVSSSKPFL